MPTLVKEWRSTTLAETDRVALDVLDIVRAGDVVGLVGALGAGKTALVGSVLRSLGVHVPSRSPTFSLVHTYPIAQAVHGITQVYHLDLYRINDVSELATVGWEDIVRDTESLVCVEWPDKVPQVLDRCSYIMRCSGAQGVHTYTLERR